jgi:hypothetical protein
MTLAAEAIMNQAIIVRETAPGVTLRAGSRAMRKTTAAAIKIPAAPAATPREREYNVNLTRVRASHIPIIIGKTARPMAKQPLETAPNGRAIQKRSSVFEPGRQGNPESAMAATAWGPVHPH